MGLYILNNLGAAAIHLLRWRDSPLLVGQGREGSFFSLNLHCHRNGDTPKQHKALLQQLFHQREVGVQACFLIHSAAYVMTSTTPVIENCPDLKEGSELKHSVWKLKGWTAVIFLKKCKWSKTLDCSDAWKKIHITTFKGVISSNFEVFRNTLPSILIISRVH